MTSDYFSSINPFLVRWQQHNAACYGESTNHDMTWFSSKKDASWSRPTAIFFKMKNFIIFLLFFITNFQNNGVLSKNRFNVIDAKNSRIYHGPGNPNRRDLSSFILRAKPTSIPSVKYFTGRYYKIWQILKHFAGSFHQA